MPSGDLDMQPLAVRFPLALRSFERTFHPQRLNEPPGEWDPQRWHLRWECDANDMGVPLSEVPDEQEAYTALGQKPTARLCYDGSERGPILRAALKQGVSVILWARGKTKRQQDVDRVCQLLLTEDDEKTPVARDALLERFHELRRSGRIPAGVRMLFDPPFPFAEEGLEAQEFTDVGLRQPEGTEDEEED